MFANRFSSQHKLLFAELWSTYKVHLAALLKHLGGGQPPSIPWHAQPQTHEIQDANSNLGISKVFWNPCLGHDTIWRPGQEMKVYVDNNKHVDK